MNAAPLTQTAGPGGWPCCRWCDAPIRLLFAGGIWAWVHLDAGYSCRGPGRVLLSTHAEPPPSR